MTGKPALGNVRVVAMGQLLADPARSVSAVGQAYRATFTRRQLPRKSYSVLDQRLAAARVTAVLRYETGPNNQRLSAIAIAPTSAGARRAAGAEIGSNPR